MKCSGNSPLDQRSKSKEATRFFGTIEPERFERWVATASANSYQRAMRDASAQRARALTPVMGDVCYGPVGTRASRAPVNKLISNT